MYIPITGGCYSEKINLVEGGKSLFMAYLDLLIMFLISLSLCSGVVQGRVNCWWSVLKL